jgi:hypothetical protein
LIRSKVIFLNKKRGVGEERKGKERKGKEGKERKERKGRNKERKKERKPVVTFGAELEVLILLNSKPLM